MSLIDWVWMLEILSDKEREELELFCQERKLTKWDILFKEWEEANALYFLVSWAISIHKNISGEDVHLWDITAENILWEMAIFWTSWTRTATALAEEDSILITIMSFSIKNMAESNPSLLSKIQNVIDDRMIKNKLLENSLKSK